MFDKLKYTYRQANNFYEYKADDFIESGDIGGGNEHLGKLNLQTMGNISKISHKNTNYIFNGG